MWGCSSAGRARASHVRGQGFDPPHLHHVGTDYALFRFLFAQKSVTRAVIPPFRKKSRKRRLLGCKRPRDASRFATNFLRF